MEWSLTELARPGVVGLIAFVASAGAQSAAPRSFSELLATHDALASQIQFGYFDVDMVIARSRTPSDIAEEMDLRAQQEDAVRRNTHLTPEQIEQAVRSLRSGWEQEGDPQPVSEERYERSYAFDHDSKSYLLQEKRVAEGGFTVDRQIAMRDGKQVRYYPEPGTAVVDVQSGVRAQDIPVYLGLFESANFSAARTIDELVESPGADGGESFYRIGYEDGNEMRIHVDSTLGFRYTLIEYVSPDGRVFKDVRADEYKVFDSGALLPERYVETEYRFDDNGQREVARSFTLSVVDADFATRPPSSTYAINLPVGTSVTDASLGVVYTVGEELRDIEDVLNASAAVTDPEARFDVVDIASADETAGDDTPAAASGDDDAHATAKNVPVSSSGGSGSMPIAAVFAGCVLVGVAVAVKFRRVGA